MKINDRLKGLGVAMVTPFHENGAVDYESLHYLSNFLIEGGVDYLVLLGTTAETPTLNHEERKQIVRTVIQVNAERVPIVVGMGGNSTHALLDEMESFDWNGVDAILSVTPYYNRPSQEGLFQHYKLLAQHAPRPLILYTVQSRTASNLDSVTTLRLAELDQIIGIKEASGNLNQMMRVIKHKPKDFMVISGDDAISLPLMSVGADGVISVTANAFPQRMSQMVHAALNSDFATARAYHAELLDIMQACFVEGNPAGVKQFLALQNKIKPYLRLPLVPVSESLKNRMQQLIESLS
ncbi:MAG TPA: 4-hydroxy-tetrahydrodipicolinate synthase [Bacteroidales bacterium]|nr:4-hydroxy-tetrahydrodipicolinate synthase [Bacteroidales bacterium]HOH23212.1 4-hydroxy-tetrahydrodipicolinate synthase [Bacteroidales bacterium]HPZ04071.1 4-hydroxy-tetrahydrodipicolinate synthase [Bacteroidales bacterium]HQB75893.1 4-hydroxy-tetrahydrodipicolinate synthase [Bacteroidales bacterium]